ncbi:hypothetical protein CC351_18220 [Salmonella enterica subsp. enterica serovar Panama]|nr:hypothetical protein [Salmonella enterica]EDH9119068.1 hypothetical protein [Salmonella enterica subsp. enterica serovar Panama]EDI7118088.1 hypothetical protein [Salmonella enterica subsp. enterica serovar Montevideo]EEA7303733.1 hypothetical protein [Salmonella enterica subsp. enterica serovar Panama]
MTHYSPVASLKFITKSLRSGGKKREHREKTRPGSAQAGRDYCVLAVVVDVCPVPGSSWNTTST